jgi:hypothetical protein
LVSTAFDVQKEGMLVRTQSVHHLLQKAKDTGVSFGEKGFLEER